MKKTSLCCGKSLIILNVVIEIYDMEDFVLSYIILHVK